jgi:type II secretion system protein J
MKTMRHNTKVGDRAFTMVEVLLAMGIFSLVIIAIYSSWTAIMRGTRVGLSAAAEVQRTRVAVRSMEEALSAAVMYADNPMYYGFFADTSGEYAYLSFVARLPESFPGSGLFPGQPLRRVTFSVDGERNLLLMQSTLLDLSETPYTIKLAPKTAVFAMEFFDARLNEWVPEWIATNALPSMVRLALDFGDKTSAESVTIRSVPMASFAITRAGGTQAQMGGGMVGGGGGVRPGGGRGDRIERGNNGRGGRDNRGRGGDGGRNAGGGGNFNAGFDRPQPRPPNLPGTFGQGGATQNPVFGGR